MSEITINSTWYLWVNGGRKSNKIELEIPVSLEKRGTNFAVATAWPTWDQWKKILSPFESVQDLDEHLFGSLESHSNECRVTVNDNQYYLESVSHKSLNPIVTEEGTILD